MRATSGDAEGVSAGARLLPRETPPESLVRRCVLFHGLQLWVNLPRKDKFVTPRYQDLRADSTTLLTTHDGASLVRLIAGDVAGHRGPGSTHTPMTMIHATIAPGAELALPWRADFNALAYVMSGTGLLLSLIHI